MRIQKRFMVVLCCFMMIGLLIAGNQSKAAGFTSKGIYLVTGGKQKVLVTGTTKKVTYSTANKRIATVDVNGWVRGVSKGYTKVYATVQGKRYSCTVKVEDASINRRSATLNVNDMVSLKLNQSTQKGRWYTSNKSVIAVSKRGTIKALKPGIATITVIADYKKFTCKVTVKSDGKASSIKDIHSMVKKAYGSSYLANYTVPESQAKEILGLKSGSYKELIMDMPRISAHVDTFVAVAPSKGKQDEVYKALLNYKNYLVKDTFQYPGNVQKIKAASVIKLDEYVFFIMLGKPAENISSESGQYKYYTEQNQIAIQAINNCLK